MNEARCLFCRVAADGAPEPCALHVQPALGTAPREAAVPPLPVRDCRCSRCGVLGHNRRTCTAALASDVRKR